MHALLDQLTLVIMSYERPSYLVRNLRYWSNRGPRVIALDGSRDPLSAAELERFGDQIRYLHVPKSYRERLGKVQQHLQTPYVALLADDDYYLPSALEAAIAFLQDHLDYAACTGRPFGFSYDPAVGVFGVPGVYGDMNKNYRVTANSPGERMVEHMGRYMPSTIYAVLRAENWPKTVEGYLRKESSICAIHELTIELAIAYLGKSMVLPVLSWLKSAELPQITGPEPSFLRTNELHNFWNQEDASLRSEFLDQMTGVLAEVDHRTKEVVANEIERAMDAYVAWCTMYFKSVTSFYATREFAKRVLPAPLTNAITRRLRAMRAKRSEAIKKIPLVDFGQRLAESGTAVDLNELKEIVELVEAFHSDAALAVS